MKKMTEARRMHHKRTATKRSRRHQHMEGLRAVFTRDEMASYRLYGPAIARRRGLRAKLARLGAMYGSGVASFKSSLQAIADSFLYSRTFIAPDPARRAPK